MVSELISSIILAIVQGISEWFPISSDGHLVLFSKFLGVKSDLNFDVALHFGTLMAVFVFFGKDIVDIIKDLVSGKWSSQNGKLGIYIVVATIPAVIVGFLFRKYFESAFESLALTTLGFAITGIFLLIASMPSKKNASNYFCAPARFTRKYSKTCEASPNAHKKAGALYNLNYKNSFLIGVAQVFALFPGVSRSAATIGTGLLTGLDEKSAMKFSFLMSIPVVFGANILVIGNNSLPASLIIPTFVSFIVGIFAIYLLYDKILNSRKNLKWFAFYVLALAAVLAVWQII